jgi:hypothetical protein
VKANVLDDKRRLVMPPELPARSAVTIQQLDEVTWLVKRRLPARNYKMVAIPLVNKLPDDPTWEKTELALARRAARHLPEPEN